MNNTTTFIDDENNSSWYDGADGPSYHTRIAFASTWILIAVAGILGKTKRK
jgi:hypothetical protein